MEFAVIKGERMYRVDGSLARTLDSGETTSVLRVTLHRSLRRLGLLRGPEKYKVLERRRRAAQIKARHLLDLIDVQEQSQRH
jgi:hypothetical protein